MAEKTIKTLIKLKTATYEKWIEKDPVLLKGEVGVATISTVQDGVVNTVPSVLLKVGDGTHKFSELNFASALAADVYEYAKKPEADFIAWVKEITAETYDAKGAADAVKALLEEYKTSNDARVDTLEEKVAALEAGIYDDTEIRGLINTNKEDIAAIKDGETLDSFKDVETELAKYQLAGDYAAEEHTHEMADVTGLVDALAGKETAGEAAKVQAALDEYKTANDAAVALKAAQADLEAEVTRATAAEKANADAITAIKDGATLDNFKDVEDMFAAKDTAIAEAKKAGTDAQATANANAEDIESLEGRIDSLEKGTYDDTEVRGLITANTEAIAAEKERAEGVEAGLDTRLKAVEDDYLVEADKTELQGNIDEVSAKVTKLIGDDADKSVRTIANEELAKQLITEDAAENLNSLEEIAAWIQSHPDDASAMNAAIIALQNQLVGIDAGEGTVKKYVDDAITALNVGQYALAADLTALAARVTVLETAKEEHATLLEGLRTDVDAKASQEDLDALDERVEALETHAILDTDTIILDCGTVE